MGHRDRRLYELARRLQLGPDRRSAVPDDAGRAGGGLFHLDAHLHCDSFRHALLALGTALWAFFKTHPELLDPTGKTDQIFPWFIAGQLPAGVSGLVIAALFAAAMSSLDSSMNSMATAITTDFYGRFRPRITDRHRLRVARVLTAMLGVSGTGVALYTARLGSTSIWDLNFEIAGLFGAGLAGLFAAGVLTRRTSGAGILVGFLASGVVLYFVKYSTDIHFFLYGAAGILSCVLIAGWPAGSSPVTARIWEG